MIRNERKRNVLAFLAAQRRPATAQEIAWGIRLPYQTRGLYRLLGGYLRWGLVLRAPGPDGQFLYRIGRRGRARLAWLMRRAR